MRPLTLTRRTITDAGTQKRHERAGCEEMAVLSHRPGVLGGKGRRIVRQANRRHGCLPEKAQSMKCVICHGDEIKVMDVKEEFTVGNDIVYVPIKVPICKTCGERYYDRRTVQFLEGVEDKLVKIKTDLKEVGKVLMYEASHFV